MMRLTALFTALLAPALATSAMAQTAQNVLVVINEASAESRDVGEYYIQKRQIPAGNVVRLEAPLTDEIDRVAYGSRIEAPIAAWMTRHSGWDRILYIVLTKGVPLRIGGTSGQTGTVSSVDSELTLLYRKMAGSPIIFNGPIRNPYYTESIPAEGLKPFTHEQHDIFLVTRLDGFTAAQARSLVDRALAPSRDGQIVLDGRIEVGAQTPGNGWLERAAEALRRISSWRDRVTVDTGGQRAGRGANLFGYYSWGSNDLVVQAAGAPDLSFVPGALAAMFVSSDARTFRQPPEGWRPGTKAEFAGTNQSLTADLIREGVTGAAGHVAEPYLIAAIRPDVLFPAYVSGANLAESFYAAMPYLSWQTVVIGDPLCAPFRQRSLEPSQIESVVDPLSELPGYFTQHRVQSPGRGSVNVDAWKMFIRAEHLANRGEAVRARAELEKATQADDRLVSGHLALAAMAQARADWDEAIARFRRVVAHQPGNVVALNDLAYLLAERKNAATEALPLASKAYQLSKGLPAVADTLAWTLHLLGRDADAAPVIRQAIKPMSGNAEVQWHAAVILSAVGDRAAASAALDAAIKAAPAFADRADVRALRSRLQAPPK